MLGRGATNSTWKSLRSEVFVICAILIATGISCALIGPAYMGQLLAYAIGLILLIIAFLTLAIRPWNYLKDLETKSMAYRDSLMGAKKKHLQYSHQDAYWHHESEDGYHPRICDRCGMIMDNGSCRKCDENH